MDFEQLVSGSEKLLSHIARPDGIPRLNKNLGEIVSVFPSRLSHSWSLVSLSEHH